MATISSIVIFFREPREDDIEEIEGVIWDGDDDWPLEREEEAFGFRVPT